VGCASMYGADFLNAKCAMPAATFQHSNHIGVPIVRQKVMLVAVNSLTSDGKSAPSSFKVKTVFKFLRIFEMRQLVIKTSNSRPAGLRQRLLVWARQRLTDVSIHHRSHGLQKNNHF
jgi:hypothetical protein